MTMMITNALGVSFAAPRALTALILSFVFGLLVLVANKTLMVKGIFYVLNSLVIFCVANGANGIGASQQRVTLNLVTPALAEARSTSVDELQATYKKLSEEYEALSKKIAESKTAATSKDELLSLIARRDEVDKSRTEVLQNIIKSTTGISIDDIKKTAPLGGDNSLIRKPFFTQWRF
jgi:hypothetical protein